MASTMPAGIDIDDAIEGAEPDLVELEKPQAARNSTAVAETVTAAARKR